MKVFVEYTKIPDDVCRKCRYAYDEHPLIWRWTKKIGGAQTGHVYCILYARWWLRKVGNGWVWRRTMKIERPNHTQLGFLNERR